MSTPVSKCTVFIQVWVDTHAIHPASSRGIYLVDRRRGRGRRGHLAGNMQTTVARNAHICWTVLPVDPAFTAAGGTLRMQSIGNSSAWGVAGQPQMVDAMTFTGTACTAGTASYHIGIDVQLPGKSSMTLSLNPRVTVD